MTIRPPALLLLILFASAAPADDSRRAFTLEDLYRVKGVGEPAISPDGKTVVYAVSTNDWAAKKKTAALWRTDADGGNPRQITSGEALDEHPSFSPDGKTLAFVSTRAGEPQLFFLPLAGGEAEQKTRFPGGINGPALLEGRPIRRLRGRRDAGLRRRRRLQQEGADAREANKLKAHLADSLLYRHWTGVEGREAHARPPPRPRRGRRGQGDPRPDARRLRLPRLLAGRRSASSTSRPTGRSWRSPRTATRTRPSRRTPTSGPCPWPATRRRLAAPKNLTASNKGFDGSPRYSPDGRFLAFKRQTTPRYESDRLRLVLLDRRPAPARPHRVLRRHAPGLRVLEGRDRGSSSRPT